MQYFDLNLISIEHLVAGIRTFFKVPNKLKTKEVVTCLSLQLKTNIPDIRLSPLDI